MCVRPPSPPVPHNVFTTDGHFWGFSPPAETEKHYQASRQVARGSTLAVETTSPASAAAHAHRISRHPMNRHRELRKQHKHTPTVSAAPHAMSIGACGLCSLFNRRCSRGPGACSDPPRSPPSSSSSSAARHLPLPCLPDPCRGGFDGVGHARGGGLLHQSGGSLGVEVVRRQGAGVPLVGESEGPSPRRRPLSLALVLSIRRRAGRSVQEVNKTTSAMDKTQKGVADFREEGWMKKALRYRSRSRSQKYRYSSQGRAGLSRLEFSKFQDFGSM